MCRLFFVFIFFVSGCAVGTQSLDAALSQNSIRPINASNYETYLIYPKETDNFIGSDVVQFDDPFQGAAVYFEDKNNRANTITLLVSPILAADWQDQERILSDISRSYLVELDEIVKQGIYLSRESETVKEFIVNKDSQSFKGKKIVYFYTDVRGVNSIANIYYFLQKDKMVNFRISSPILAGQNWSGDNIVETLLPTISVPNESTYMRQIREQSRVE